MMLAHLEHEQREDPPLNSALDGSSSRCIFVTHRRSKIPLLVNTGADLCVYSRTGLRGQTKKCDYELFAANGS